MELCLKRGIRIIVVTTAIAMTAEIMTIPFFSAFNQTPPVYLINASVHFVQMLLYVLNEFELCPASDKIMLGIIGFEICISVEIIG